MDSVASTATPPSFEQVLAVLREFGRRHADLLSQVELFGSVLHGDAGPGSDVDVLVTFMSGRRPKGLDYFGLIGELQDELSKRLGVPVDVLDRAAVEQDPNPYRRTRILDFAHQVYAGP